MHSIIRTTKKLTLGLAALALVLVSSGIAGAQFEPAQQPQQTSIVGVWAKATQLPDGRSGVLAFAFRADQHFIMATLDDKGNPMQKLEGTYTTVEGRYLKLTFADGSVATWPARLDNGRMVVTVNGQTVVLERVPEKQ